MASQLHPDQLPVGADDVARLLRAQFPQWAGLPITRIDSSGTVNAMFRLGDELVVRLPFVEWGGPDILREAEWLPRLAPHLPAPIPRVLGVGEPDDAYPCPWLIVDWMSGRNPAPDAPAEHSPTADALALDLAAFVAALRTIDTAGAPTGYRGADLGRLDEPVHECLARVADLVDVAALTDSWSASLSAAPSEDAPVWVHGDLLVGNVLVDDRGRLAGVLDFATAGIGDSATDLMAAWSILPPDGRDTFRAALGDDEAAWQRGRGWALSQAVFALPYYRDTNPVMARNSLQILRALSGR